VSSANFAGSSPLARSLERVAGLLLGRGGRSTRPIVVEDYRERVALLDLAGQRLESVAIDTGADALAAVEEALWSSDEREVVLEGSRSDDQRGRWRLTLDPMRLAAISVADRGREERRTLVAGPDGGYRGVSGEEEETEDERPFELAVADGLRNTAEPRQPAFLRSPSRLYLLPSWSTGLWPALDGLLREGDVVDLDTAPRAGVAVLQTSHGGGVARLIALKGSTRMALSARPEAAESVPLHLSPFPVLGPRSGLASVAADLRGERSGSLWLVALIATAVVLLFMWRRWASGSR
jgi:hypothetical protein